MDLSGVIMALATGTYTVTRRAAGSVSGGIYAPGSSSTLSVKALVQPGEPEHLERLPEGTRLDDVKVVFSSSPLYTQNEATGAPADLLSIDGKSYEVEAVRDFVATGAFVQAIARRADPS